MIIDDNFLSAQEIDGIKATIFSQEVPVFWTFHSDQVQMNHYTKIKTGEQSKFKKITDNVLKRFCDKNNVKNNSLSSSRIILIPQNSTVQNVVYESKEKILLYVVDSSDAKIIVNKEMFESVAGSGILVDSGETYSFTAPAKDDFAALVEVSFSDNFIL